MLHSRVRSHSILMSFFVFISGDHFERRDKAGQRIHAFFHSGNRNGKMECMKVSLAFKKDDLL